MTYDYSVYAYTTEDDFENDAQFGIVDVNGGFRKPETAMTAGIQYAFAGRNRGMQEFANRDVVMVNVFRVSPNGDRWCIMSNVIKGFSAT